MIPLKDHNPTRCPAVVTFLIIAVCLWIYFFVQPTGRGMLMPRTADEQLDEVVWTVQNAAIPCELVRGRPLTVSEVERTFLANDPDACQETPAGRPFDEGKNVYLAVLYSMFLHGSVLHLAGNMLYLWVFGNNIEDRMRPLGYVLFYLAGGVVATLTHVALQPDSTVPVVGASGAIAAVMGGYLVLFPEARVLSIVPIFFFGFLEDVPAKWVLGFWFISQFFISPNTGVAWAAHVGGFVFGVVVTLLLRDRLRPAPQPHIWEAGYL